ncbi:DUF3693 domain-containing protein [Pseudoalteromonas piscicida]|uniref:DUF3693 domain-containing protein n=1 Tax=Pseudoalteromonas piscicida TaxID=43662 RepID=UPI001CB7E937
MAKPAIIAAPTGPPISAIAPDAARTAILARLAAAVYVLVAAVSVACVATARWFAIASCAIARLLSSVVRATFSWCCANCCACTAALC